MKKISRLFVPVCFSALLLLIMVVTLLHPMEYTSFFENRDLATFPAITADGILDGSFFTELENFLTDHSAGRISLLKVKTKIDMDVLKRPVVNTIAVTDEYLLPYNNFDEPSDSDVQEEADAIAKNLAQVSALTESYGGEYYYVAVPNQSCVQSAEYPWYLKSKRDSYGKTVSTLSEKLDKLGVNFIDIGENYDALGNPSYLTSKVDNHFTAYGALVTYRAITEKINEDTGLNLHVYNDEELVFEEMPDYYLGSRSRMLMNLRKNSEHLTLIYPKETVPFTRSDDGIPVESTVFLMPDKDAQWVTYGVYMGGDIAETVIETDRSSLPNILIYGDSFTNGVECIICNSFNVMRSLDLRHYDKMTLGEYIAEYRPDIVVCVRDYASLTDTTNNGAGVNGEEQ